MAAGENTLDALVTRVLTQSILKQGALDADDYRTGYISFMTTPGTHNDTYAGTCHRMFFKNMVDGVTPKDCPDNDAHNVDAIDALMVLPPVVLSHIHSTPTERSKAIKIAIQTTRQTNAVLKYANAYSDMLLSLLEGMSMQDAAQNAGAVLGYDIAAQVRRSSRDMDPMVACYIDSSFPAMLFFAHKYGEQGIETLLLASANAGGENVGRGSLLGALAGARYGKKSIPQSLVDGLVLSEALQSESSLFAETFGATHSG
jgi:ADP-ribosyl-[dinitrogen reductase] hydrolase